MKLLSLSQFYAPKHKIKQRVSFVVSFVAWLRFSRLKLENVKPICCKLSSILLTKNEEAFAKAKRIRCWIWNPRCGAIVYILVEDCREFYCMFRREV